MGQPELPCRNDTVIMAARSGGTGVGLGEKDLPGARTGLHGRPQTLLGLPGGRAVSLAAATLSSPHRQLRPLHELRRRPDGLGHGPWRAASDKTSHQPPGFDSAAYRRGAGKGVKADQLPGTLRPPHRHAGPDTWKGTSRSPYPCGTPPRLRSCLAALCPSGG